MNTTYVEQEKNRELHSHKLQLNYVVQNYKIGKRKDGVVFREEHIGGFSGAHSELLLSSGYTTLFLVYGYSVNYPMIYILFSIYVIIFPPKKKKYLNGKIYITNLISRCVISIRFFSSKDIILNVLSHCSLSIFVSVGSCFRN